MRDTSTGLPCAGPGQGMAWGSPCCAGQKSALPQRAMDVLRLDCVASNRVLRDYYEAAGFICQVPMTFRDDQGELWGLSLYEKPVRFNPADIE